MKNLREYIYIIAFVLLIVGTLIPFVDYVYYPHKNILNVIDDWGWLIIIDWLLFAAFVIKLYRISTNDC